MICQIQINNKNVRFDTDVYHHISLGLSNGQDNPDCFYLPEPVFTPFRAGNFVGSTQEGGNCNCYTLTISPHGNGTHTECIGHIVGGFTIHQCLKTIISSATLISITPTLISHNDYVITKETLVSKIQDTDCKSLIIRTLPNSDEKKNRSYSGKNPPYFTADALEICVEKNIEHLLVDLPSVDREEDGGALSAHKAFWNFPHAPRNFATITELIYVPDNIPDGDYILMHNIAPLESDASPSRPIIFPIMK
ncbi:MAG: cyclase family protein [Candidatus Kapabacteria bacterium]|nr:cyclase family protein [Candidatus Kapabacteria bacterium]